MLTARSAALHGILFMHLSRSADHDPHGSAVLSSVFCVALSLTSVHPCRQVISYLIGQGGDVSEAPFPAMAPQVTHASKRQNGAGPGAGGVATGCLIGDASSQLHLGSPGVFFLLLHFSAPPTSRHSKGPPRLSNAPRSLTVVSFFGIEIHSVPARLRRFHLFSPEEGHSATSSIFRRFVLFRQLPHPRFLPRLLSPPFPSYPVVFRLAVRHHTFRNRFVYLQSTSS
jgi:hypothetical protein